ncbi:hypothetical protein SO802_005231 [Lithocarpus litseifolius]|uniref:F-box domain-containing protein n=1 Tax=Lithocarpus litseifolius TaxID=425828 RepID=A0AAW2DKD0_9ROSI
MDVVRCSSSLLQRLSIDDLPDCLLIEILTQLPLKSIFQCKCVSRRWCSLISAPSFAYIVHRLRSSSILQRPSTLLISHYIDGVRKVRMTLEEPEFKSLASLINQYYINNRSVSLDIVHASCHDLLLCTQKKLKLFSEVVDIFSSDTGKWSESIGSCPLGFHFTDYAHSYAGVPYQGLLFWWRLDGHLVGFDPYTCKCCRVIYKPEELAPNRRILRLGVCNGALRICQLAGRPYADDIST